MDSGRMTGLANAASAKADTTTRKNANILASTATSAAATEAPNVAEEGEKIGITTTVTKTGTGIKKARTKDSGGQKAKTKHTKDQLTDKELLESHSGFKQIETTEEQALPTRVQRTTTIEVTAIHQEMTGETQTSGETRTPAATELEENRQAPPAHEICLATTHLYSTQSE